MHAYVLAKSNAKFRRSSSPAKVNKTIAESSAASTLIVSADAELSTIMRRAQIEPASSTSSFQDGSNKTYKSHASLVQIALPNQQVSTKEKENFNYTFYVLFMFKRVINVSTFIMRKNCLFFVFPVGKMF